MGITRNGPTLLTYLKCRKANVGYDPLPDCPAWGFDDRGREGFRRDVLVYLLSILGSIGVPLISSSYRSVFGGTLPSWFHLQTATVWRSAQAANGPRRFMPRVMV